MLIDDKMVLIDKNLQITHYIQSLYIMSATS